MVIDLVEVLRGAGLTVVEEKGWRDRGRPGAFGPVKGVICHHTSGSRRGPAPSLSTVLKGRADLPGPLSQLLLDRDGVFHVIAAGRCNHAGKGRWQGITDGNRYFIGIEAENDGVGEPWPRPQLDAYARGCAAILSHVGADAVMCCGHKEFALPKGRKTDPNFDMVQFRQSVELVMAGVGYSADALPPVPADPHRAMLFKGASGDSVKQLQKALGKFYTGKVDGDFGPKTEAAVMAFQKAKKLTVDGKVGPKTWAALGVK